MNSLLSEGQKFLYVYDFGDDWRHEVTVEEIRDGSAEDKWSKISGPAYWEYEGETLDGRRQRMEEAD